MADDILEFLGITGDPKEHPADVDTLSFFGLKPHKEEHPAYTPPLGMEDPEARFKRAETLPPPKSGLQKVHEAIDPYTILPAAGSDILKNTADYFMSSARMAGEGLSDIWENKPASGVGKAVMGAAGVPLSVVAGPVKSGENALASITGNPDFTSKAALVAPINIGKPVAKTATYRIQPSTRAADEVVTMAGGPEAAREMLRRMEENPRLRAIDVNDNLRVGAQSLIDPGQPRAMQSVVKSAESSAKSAPDAVRAAYDTHLGPAPNPVKEMKVLMDKASDVGKTKIQPALDVSKPVDMSGVLEKMDKVLNPAPVKMTPGTSIQATPLQERLAELRRKIAAGDTEVLTDANRLHGIQSDLRREAQELIDARGPSAKLGRELMNFRNQMVDAIEAAAPGYKKGLEEFRDVKDVTRAFEQGAGILTNAKGVSEKALETHPEALRDWMRTASPEEIAARRLGARYAVAQKMESFKNAALAGTDVGKVDLSRQKYEILFDKEQTDKMWKLLEDEREIAHSNSRIMGNSKTAETLAAREHLKPREIEAPHGGLPGWAIPMGLGAAGLTQNPTVGALVGGGLAAMRGARSGYQWLGRQADISRNASFADLVTSMGPDKNVAMARIAAAADRADRRNKLSNLLSPP